jgi:hypothetical protein
LMALVGIMGNRDYMADVQKKTLGGIGATDKNFAVIAEEAGFKTQQALNEKTFATQTAFETLAPLVGAASEGFTALGTSFPTLTAALVGATTGLVALAAATFGMAGLSALTGGKGAGILGAGKGVISGAAGMLGRGALAMGGALLTGTSAAVGVGGAIGYGAGTLAYDKGIQGTEFGNNIGGMIATIMAKLGDKDAASAIEVNLHLDGEQITTVVNHRNARNASRH